MFPNATTAAGGIDSAPANMTSTLPVTLGFQIGLSTFAAVLFLLSLVGNTVVIYVVCTRSHMKNSTNILIANMALGDLLLTIAIPYVVKWLYVDNAWFGADFFAAFVCKFLHSAQLGSIACSVFTLVLISLDRCLAIMYPLRRIFTNKILKFSIAGIWISAIAMSTPIFIVTQTEEKQGIYICTEFWQHFPAINPERYILAFSTCTYFVPLVLIAIAYTITGIRLWNRQLPGNENLLAKQKIHATNKKATIMLVTVVLVFALCWLPLQIREILKFYSEKFRIPSKLDIVLPWIGFSNIVINPILYVIFSENYRNEFLSILCCHESQKLDVYRGLQSAPERSTPLGTPMLSRRGTERLSLSPNIDRHQLSLSNHSLIQMKKINGNYGKQNGKQ